MIKKLKIKYKCGSCGNEFTFEREVVIDGYSKNIPIIHPKRGCNCGQDTGFIILGVTLED